VAVVLPFRRFENGRDLVQALASGRPVCVARFARTAAMLAGRSIVHAIGGHNIEDHADHGAFFAPHPLALLAALKAAVAEPAAIVGQRLQQEALWQLVDQLDDRLRLPILLHYRYGMTGEEIAGALGVAKNTVYEQLSQGRKRLRQLHQLAEVGLPNLLGGESC
jgi:RNA polymerase sigma factor (sigma-70 family)